MVSPLLPDWQGPDVDHGQEGDESGQGIVVGAEGQARLGYGKLSGFFPLHRHT